MEEITTKIPEFRTKEDIDFMKSMYRAPKQYKNHITEKQHAQLMDLWANHKDEQQFEAGGGASLRFPYEWEQLDPIIGDTIRDLVGHDGWRFISGRLYHIHGQKVWDRIHTDNWNMVKTQGVKAPNNKGDKLLNWLKDNPQHVYKPFMTYVFPLDFSHEASTVVFDQTYWGVESIYYNGHKDRVHKYIERIDPGYHINEDTYNKYLRHIPKDILEGFTVKELYDWQPQDVISWVSPQIHVAGAMDLGWTKTGVTVWIAHKE